jgi:phosphatidylinositol alpha-1,6-mannosyltransferase
MRTLIVSTEFPPLIGGIGTFAHNLAKGLQEVGVSVHMLTSVGAGGKEFIRDVPITRTPPMLNRRFLKIAPLLSAAVWICLRDRPDKLLAMAWTHEGIVAYLVKKVLGVRYALIAHGGEILPHQQSWLRRALMLRILKDAETVVANSLFTKRLVVALGLDPAAVEVVNPPIALPNLPVTLDTTEVDEKFELEGKRVILTAARLVRRKGHAQVIRVLSELQERYPNLVYVMTGDGEYRRELETLVQRYGVAGRVRITGYVSQAELEQLYYRAEVYISPSLEEEGDVEGFGIAFVEASAYGKPVIAGRSGGVTDAVANGETGFLVDPNDAGEIKRKLVALLDDETLREQLAKAGRARVATKFGLRSQSEKLKEVMLARR